MGMSLVITSTNITEILYMEVLKIVVSAMFGFRRFIRQHWSCMLPCALDVLVDYLVAQTGWTCGNYNTPSIVTIHCVISMNSFTVFILENSAREVFRQRHTIVVMSACLSASKQFQFLSPDC